MSTPQAARILHIIPGTGWEAIYHNPEEPTMLFASPLVCWALVEYPDGTRAVQGMHATDGVVFCEDELHFRGYQTSEPPQGLTPEDLHDEP